MIYVALAVLASTALGIAAERHTIWATRLSRVSLARLIATIIVWSTVIVLAVAS